MHDDGSFVITKHPGTGGRVNVGTVTAQLLYEIDGARYFNPDVVARFDTITLTDEGNDRVRGSGTRGEPPPPTLKVAMNVAGGWRNSMSVRLAGLDLDDKANLVEQLVRRGVGRARALRRVARRAQARHARRIPRDNEAATSYLTITVKSPDKAIVGKAWSSRARRAVAVERARPLDRASARGRDAVPRLLAGARRRGACAGDAVARRRGHRHRADDDDCADDDGADAATRARARRRTAAAAAGRRTDARAARPRLRHALRRQGRQRQPRHLGAQRRRADAAYAWLAHELTVDKLRALFPDLAPFAIDRAMLPNLHAVNFTIRGILGDGVAASTRSDPQAKTLGEYVRARVVELPGELVAMRSTPLPEPVRPTIVAVEMGYGHLRPAHALADYLGGACSRPIAPPLAGSDEQRTWARARRNYEALTRLSQLPLIGRPLSPLLGVLTAIPPLYPARDLSNPTWPVHLVERMAARGLGRGLVEHLRSTATPLLTTFFVPALIADRAGRPRRPLRRHRQRHQSRLGADASGARRASATSRRRRAWCDGSSPTACRASASR